MGIQRLTKSELEKLFFPATVKMERGGTRKQRAAALANCLNGLNAHSFQAAHERAEAQKAAEDKVAEIEEAPETEATE